MKSYIGREHMLMSQNVCLDCFDDDGISNFIHRYGKSNDCAYCESSSRSHKISDIIEHINNCLLSEYEHPVECMGWNGREGGYIGATTYDSYEILEEVGLETGSSNLFNDIASNLPTDMWCQREPYQLRNREEAAYTWTNFCELIKYKCRYMFLHHEDMENEKSFERVLVSSVLGHILHSFQTIKIVNKLRKGKRFYRARFYNPENKFELTTKELGIPPKGVPGSSRMSPAGIPMFYASDDMDTSIKEIKAETEDEVLEPI